MSQHFLLDRLHFVNALPPVADAFDTAQNSDVIDMSEFAELIFVIHKGVGTAGVNTITVEACSDTTPSAVSLIPFRYRAITSTDVHGAQTEAASTGVSMTAGSNHVWVVSVLAEDLLASGYRYVRLATDETTDGAVLAGILAFGIPTYGTNSGISRID